MTSQLLNPSKQGERFITYHLAAEIFSAMRR